MDKIEKLLQDEVVEYKPLGEVCENQFWLMPATPKFINDTGIPYITGKNIRDGFIDLKNVKYISNSDYLELTKSRKIIKDDILISMIGTIGEIGIVKRPDKFYGQNIYLLRLKKNKILVKYFYYFFTQPSIKNSIINKKNNSSQGYIKAVNTGISYLSS